MERVVAILSVFLMTAVAGADESVRISALEARVAALESLQDSLRSAVESISGRSLTELVKSAPASLSFIPVKTAIAPAGERLVLGLPESQARARLAQLEAHLKSLTEAGRMPAPRAAELTRVRSQVETLRQSLETW